MNQQTFALQPVQALPLPYDFSALEPVISAEIMSLHYNKHYQTYITNYNKAVEQYTEAQHKQDVAAMIALQSALKFNGGGYVNHTIFWTNLAPKNKGGGEAPTGELAQEINKEFGSFQNLIDQLSTKSIAIQGSGWGWLGYDKNAHRLTLAFCDNQDPLSTKGHIPLLGIDVWEHAYYLQYKNVRADYVKALWQIVNWTDVSQRFEKAKIK